MRNCFAVCLSLMVAVCKPVSAAQEATPVASVDAKTIDAELNEFRDKLFHAFNEEDYSRMLEEYCHKDIIATWQDGTTSEGHAGVIAEFDKLKQFISKMTVDATTDKRLILNDGRLVISSGEMRDVYELSRGPVVNLHSRWSATLVKENDRWWLVSFCAATNAFENEVLDLYLTSQKYITAAIAGLIGIVAGVVMMRVIRGRGRSVKSAAATL